MREKTDKTKKEVAEKKTRTKTKTRTTTKATSKKTKTAKTTKTTKSTKTSKTKNTNNDVENLKKEFEEVKKEKEKLKENKEKEEVKEEIKKAENNSEEEQKIENNKSEDETQKDNIIDEKLDKIKEEINSEKTKRKWCDKIEKKYYCLFFNTATTILYIMYFLLFMFGTYKIPAENLVNCINGLVIFDLLATIILLEIAYKKDNSYIFVIGIETAFLGGFTVFLLNLLNNSDMSTGIWIAVIIGIILAYYTIKTIGMWLKKRKE